MGVLGSPSTLLCNLCNRALCGSIRCMVAVFDGVPVTICPDCQEPIVNDRTGEVIGCAHIDREDFTELSGKHMSDGMPQAEADKLAFEQLTKGQRNLFDK